jgi:flagellar secretion chaperone FliS
LSHKEIDAYREIKVSSMSQQELIVFLYESSLRLLDEAKDTIAINDIPGTHEKLNRARNVFVHLLSTLNFEIGGDFAVKLSALYAFFVEKITIANVTKNVKELDDIIPIIAELKDAWANMKYDSDQSTPAKNNGAISQLVSVEV